MQDQPRFKPYQPSRLFADQRSARPIPEGTVARGHLRNDMMLYTGRTAPANTEQVVPPAAQASSGQGTGFDPGLATEFPFQITKDVIERGRMKFEQFCTPCHGYLGNGRGMIVQRGLTPPPSFHIDRLRTAPVGHFFDVITNGYGAMYSYAARVHTNDRWAIIAYIRALQFSQRASAADVPPDKMGEAREDQQQEQHPGEIQPRPPQPTQPRPKPGVAR
jgi:hypothetical protein